jgi:predicted nucleic acid-binding protein
VNEVVYDAAVLILADRNDRLVWANHRALLESGVVPLAPAAVVAQVSRTARQVQLRRFLRGCIVVAFDEASAHAAGRLLGAARASDVVDASVVALAISHRAQIMTGDPGDIEGLVAASGVRLSVVAI